MRLQDMRLLVRVAETGSMTAAGRQLHLSSSAVSSGLQRIEGGLGFRVFERTTRSLHPTDEGAVIIQGCRSVLEQWQFTMDEARGHHAGLTGTVRLSAPSDSAYSVISEVVADLCIAHPRLRVELDISDALQHVHREALDITIRYGELRDSGLVAHRLAGQPNVLVASPTYLREAGTPSCIAELTGHRLLTLRIAGQPATAWSLAGEAGPNTYAIESPMCSDGHQVRLWALAGRGIALKNLLDVIDDLLAGRLVRVLPSVTGETPPIHAVFPSRRTRPARVRAVHEALAARFEERARTCSQWLLRPV